MARLKIEYGIDLGTTNSAIARMENGKPVILKTDVQYHVMKQAGKLQLLRFLFFFGIG